MYKKEFSKKNERYNELKRIIRYYNNEDALQAISLYLIDYPNDPYVLLEYAKKIIYIDEIEGINILNRLKTNRKVKKLACRTLYYYYLNNNNSKELTNIYIDIKNVCDEYEIKYYEATYLNHFGYRDKSIKIILNLFKIYKNDNSKISFLVLSDLVTYIILHNMNMVIKNEIGFIKSVLNKSLNYNIKTYNEYYYELIILYYNCHLYDEVLQIIDKIDLNKLSLNKLKRLYIISDNLNLSIKNKIVEIMKKNNNPNLNIDILIIMDIINDNVDESLEKYKKGINKNNKEMYDTILYEWAVSKKKYDKAIEIIDYVFDCLDDSFKSTENHLKKIDLLIELKRYKEAYEYLNDEKEYFFNYDKRSLVKYELYNSYLSKKLNIIYENDLNTYTIKLIKNYDENLVKEHIEIHKYKRSKELRYFCFDEDIDIDKLLVDIKNKISNQIATKVGLFHEYIIELNGYSSESNKFLVLTFGEENYIYNCYPIDYINKEELEGYEEETDNEYIQTNKPKVKRLSQIEKFNMRYKKS